MEDTGRVWDELAYRSAVRCWEAGQTTDTETRKSLERAATRYFWKSLGMERNDAREPGIGVPAHAKGVTPDPR